MVNVRGAHRHEVPAETRRELVHRSIEVLGRLAELFRQRRLQLAAEAGLTEPQWEVLEEISTEHFMPTLFARRRESSAAAVSKLVRQLVDKGLVSVRVARGDARHRNYALTPRGKRALQVLRASREHAIEEVWLTFDPADLEHFSRFGAELAERLTRLTETAPIHPSPGRPGAGRSSTASS